MHMLYIQCKYWVRLEIAKSSEHYKLYFRPVVRKALVINANGQLFIIEVEFKTKLNSLLSSSNRYSVSFNKVTMTTCARVTSTRESSNHYHLITPCLVLEGYYDYLCESNINECDSMPCTNGGECIDGINRFECVCPRGYEGAQCQRETNECVSNPCQHGATCEDLSGDYKCRCQLGYTGTLCFCCKTWVSGGIVILWEGGRRYDFMVSCCVFYGNVIVYWFTSWVSIRKSL